MNALVLDVETAPLLAWVFGTKDIYLNPEDIEKDKYIMCWSAKWLGDPASKLIYRETRNGDDKAIIKELWELLNKADVVISQNGASFDEGEIKARMMIHGMQPYKPVKHHDTYRQNKDKRFTFHRLNFLTDKFCTKYKKLIHKKFPGKSLWIACLHGNKEAWAEMRKYNEYDVLSTEELYMNTRGWSTAKAPIIYENAACKYCGSNKTHHRGVDRTAKKVFQRIQCQSCGKWSRGEVVKEKK